MSDNGKVFANHCSISSKRSTKYFFANPSLCVHKAIHPGKGALMETPAVLSDSTFQKIEILIQLLLKKNFVSLIG